MNLSQIWNALSGRADQESGSFRFQNRGGEFLNDTEATAKILAAESKK